jgi:hypothetical protein
VRRRRKFGGFGGACGTEIQSEILGFGPFDALRALEYTQKAGFRGIDGACGTNIQSKNRIYGGFALCVRNILGWTRPAGAFFPLFLLFFSSSFPILLAVATREKPNFWVSRELMSRCHFVGLPLSMPVHEGGAGFGSGFIFISPTSPAKQPT